MSWEGEREEALEGRVVAGDWVCWRFCCDSRIGSARWRIVRGCDVCAFWREVRREAGDVV